MEDPPRSITAIQIWLKLQPTLISTDTKVVPVPLQNIVPDMFCCQRWNISQVCDLPHWKWLKSKNALKSVNESSLVLVQSCPQQQQSFVQGSLPLAWIQVVHLLQHCQHHLHHQQLHQLCCLHRLYLHCDCSLGVIDLCLLGRMNCSTPFIWFVNHHLVKSSSSSSLSWNMIVVIY